MLVALLLLSTGCTRMWLAITQPEKYGTAYQRRDFARFVEHGDYQCVPYCRDLFQQDDVQVRLSEKNHGNTAVCTCFAESKVHWISEHHHIMIDSIELSGNTIRTPSAIESLRHAKEAVRTENAGLVSQ